MLPIGCIRVFMTPFLQLGGDQVEPLGGGLEVRVVLGRLELEDLVAGQDELADQVHQLVEPLHVDADRRVRGTTAGAGRGRRLVDLACLRCRRDIARRLGRRNCVGQRDHLRDGVRFAADVTVAVIAAVRHRSDPVDDRRVSVVAVGTRCFDRGQHRPDRVAHLEQRASRAPG